MTTFRFGRALGALCAAISALTFAAPSAQAEGRTAEGRKPLYLSYSWVAPGDKTPATRAAMSHMDRHRLFADLHAPRRGRMVCTASGSGKVGTCIQH